MSRRKETVTIKATEAVQKLAKQAMEVQDACNSIAVTNFLLRVQKHFTEDNNGQQYRGGDMAAQNPVSLAILNKLNHLAGLEQTKLMCFDRTMDLADGKDVEWEIEFLV